MSYLREWETIRNFYDFNRRKEPLLIKLQYAVYFEERTAIRKQLTLVTHLIRKILRDQRNISEDSGYINCVTIIGVYLIINYVKEFSVEISEIENLMLKERQMNEQKSDSHGRF